MSKINILPQSLANKIAAGEVVERPASVVKELLENALDAGGTEIEVIIENSGQSSITVIDNGQGISAEDLPKACLRHATSKIRVDADLNTISTLGFRGEALASIAAVSIMKISSCEDNQPCAMRLEIEGGLIKGMFETARKRGTTIEVKNLFFNTPARLKFLKSKAAEMSHIVKIVTDLALAYPQIAFRLLHNKAEVVNFNRGETLFERMRVLFGNDICAQMVEVSFDIAPLRIYGFISKAGHGQTMKKNQFIFVNQRPVIDKTITHAIMQAYHTLLMENQLPLALIFINTRPDLVDVNVHPNKREVRFRDAGALHDVLARVIKDALSDKASLPVLAAEAGKTAHANPVLDFSFQKRNSNTYLPRLEPKELFSSSINEDVPDSCFGAGARQLPYFQADNTYIVAPGKDGVVIIDQHAAHERVLFDELLKQRQNKKVEKQKLLIPVTVRLIEEHKNIFYELGFEVEDFGGDTFAVYSYPAALGEIDIGAEFEKIITDLFNQEIEPDKIPSVTKFLASIACHCAVRAQEKLSEEKISSLLERLWKTDAPYTCPHGRPTMVTVTLNELEKRFKRV